MIVDKIKLLFLIPCLCAFCSGSSQTPKDLSKLQLMNGKLMSVALADSSGANFFFSVQKNNGKWVYKNLYKDQVFSVISPTGKESILYRKNEIIGDDYSIEDMRYFIYGESDAIKGYNVKPTFYGGLAIGAGGAYGIQGGIIFPFLIPLGYTLSMQVPFIKIKPETITDHTYTFHETYKIGYEKTARTKKAMNALFGSLIGVAIGTTVYELTHN